MLSNKEIICPDNLLNVAHKKKGAMAGIVNAGKPLPMLSVMDSKSEFAAIASNDLPLIKILPDVLIIYPSSIVLSIFTPPNPALFNFFSVITSLPPHL